MPSQENNTVASKNAETKADKNPRTQIEPRKKIPEQPQRIFQTNNQQCTTDFPSCFQFAPSYFTFAFLVSKKKSYFDNYLYRKT